MVTFTYSDGNKSVHKRVSVGCRPNGHFHAELTDRGIELIQFQWAVAQMVTFTSRNSVVLTIMDLFQWAVAQMVTFAFREIHLFVKAIMFQWAVAQMVTLDSINIILATLPATGGFLRLKHCRTSPFGIAQSGMSPGWSLSLESSIQVIYQKLFQWACRPDGHFPEVQNFFGL